MLSNGKKQLYLLIYNGTQLKYVVPLDYKIAFNDDETSFVLKQIVELVYFLSMIFTFFKLVYNFETEIY